MSVLEVVLTIPFVLLSVTKKISNVKCPVLVMLIVHRVVKEMVEPFEIFEELVLPITSKIPRILTYHIEPKYS